MTSRFISFFKLSQKLVVLFRRHLKKLIGMIIGTFILIFILNIIFPPPKTNIFSRKVVAANGDLLMPLLTVDGKWRLRTKLNDISPYLVDAIIYREDKWFYFHPGINPFAVIRAIAGNFFGSGKKSGASTITMQLARLLEPKRRTIVGKILETVRAVQIELRFTKAEILEMYLALLPFGGNIEGVTSAAYLYFNTPPLSLSPAQAAALAVIPQNPNKFRPDKGTTNLLNERNKLLRQMALDKIFSESVLNDALAEDIKETRGYFTTIAKHFSFRALSSSNEETVKTQLILSYQKATEEILSSVIDALRSRSVNNAAAMIVDNKTMNVVAYAGTADFNDKSNDGEVNGLIASRSPGSALKPVLYTLAFDQGLLTPAVKILDVPKDFSGYEPENFDRTYSGLVSTEYALLNSLNIPAVALLEQTGLNIFLDHCISAGFNGIKKKKKETGLSVILGGCGVTAEELTTYYAALANGGKFRTLRFTENADTAVKALLFSEGAAFLTWSVLSANQRPDIPSDYAEQMNIGSFAWKTGTSYGKKDAWAIGYNQEFTIAVWAGNYSGKGSPFLQGASIATPLLFRILRGVVPPGKIADLKKPVSVSVRAVCNQSGLPASANCTETKSAYYIPQKSHASVCNWHKELILSQSPLLLFCPNCLNERSDTIHKTITFYPSELISLHPELFSALPKHNPQCNAVKSGQPPEISSPASSYTYMLQHGKKNEVSLRATSSPDVAILYWYINGKLFALGKPGQNIIYVPQEGEKKITVDCTDDLGRTSTKKAVFQWY